MNNSKKIIPAIIAKSQEELVESLTKVSDFVDMVQLDVMDNEFVPNTSLFFDIDVAGFDLSYEAHLMIQFPEPWVEKYVDILDTVLVHAESDFDASRIIDLVKEKGKRFGFVLNPETPLSKIAEFLDDIDQVLIMTVNPGFYGSPFLPGMMGKIAELRKMKPDLDIEVDGGITDKTIRQVDDAGANMFVSGSYIVKSDDVAGSIKRLESLVQ